MKLSINRDFTQLPRVADVIRGSELAQRPHPAAVDTAVLDHAERHLRRRVIELSTGDRILIDLPEAAHLQDGDRLVLEGGSQVEIRASAEELHEIRPGDPVHLAELAWHIGNRHLAAQIEAARILILRDHVIKAMLEGLGATVSDVVEPFHPMRGAYAAHSHGHAGRHGNDHAHE